MNTSTFHPPSVWLTNVIMKKQYYKTCQIKKKTKQIKVLEYNITSTIWYVQALLVYYNIIIVIGKRQKSWRSLLKKQWHELQKYSPQVHKLKPLGPEKSTALKGKSHFLWGQTANLQAAWERDDVVRKEELKLVEIWWRQRLVQETRLRTLERKDTADNMTDHRGPNSS